MFDVSQEIQKEKIEEVNTARDLAITKLEEEKTALERAAEAKRKLAEATKSLTDKIYEFLHTDEEVKIRDINREYDALIETAKEVITNYNELRLAIAAINNERQKEIDGIKGVVTETDIQIDKTKELAEGYKELEKPIEDVGKTAGKVVGYIGKLPSKMEMFLGKAEAYADRIKGIMNGIAYTYGFEPIHEKETPSYAVGTPYVPETSLAVVHKGEAIIPANQNTNDNSSSYSPTVNVTVQGNGDINDIKRAVSEALNDSKRQFSRRGFELAPGM